MQVNNLTVSYVEEGNLLTRFANHFVLGVKKDIGSHEKNWVEKLGDIGLWMVEELPGKVWRVMKDPKVVTIALTAFAILGASFAFYPSATYLAIKSAILMLPEIPLWTVRLTAYLSVVGLIISTALRAEGRFLNRDLMDKFYGKTVQA